MASSLSPLSEEAEAKIDSISKTLQNTDESEIRARREVGKSILELIEDKDNIYGELTLSDISKRISYHRDTLRPCLVLANKLDDDQFEVLLDVRGPGDRKLRLAHFAVLSRVRNFDDMVALAEETVRDGLTARQLATKVTNNAGGPTSSGGRNPKKASNLAELLEQIEQFAVTTCNKIDVAWFSETSPDYCSEASETDQAVKKAVVARIEAVRDQAEVVAGKWDSVVSELRRATRSVHVPPVRK